MDNKKDISNIENSKDKNKRKVKYKKSSEKDINLFKQKVKKQLV
jgi:hypothetical protein